MKLQEQDYLRYDPFSGDMDTDVKMRTVKIVKCRTEHVCYEGQSPDSTPHKIKPGELARFEKSKADGDWHECYICLPCIEARK